MKNCGKIILTIIWTTLILSFGYYTVFTNLGSIIAVKNPGFSCRLIPEGVRLQLGNSVEVVKFKFPLQFKTGNKQWVFQSSRGTVSFTFTPRLRVKWQKPDRRRSSLKNGE